MTSCERGPGPKHEFDWLSSCYLFLPKILLYKLDTAYFKVKTADEIEVEELLFSQASIAYRATSLETAHSISYTRYNASRIIILMLNN